MREARLQDYCMQYLREKRIYFINIHGGSWSAKGAPDLLACINGKFVAFELKIGENDLQDDQKIHKIRIERSSGLHFVPRTLSEFIQIVDTLMEE